MLAIAQPRRPAARPAVVLAFPSGRVLLGALPPDSSFVDLVLPASRVSKTAGFTASDRQNLLSVVAQGYIPPYSPCSGQASGLLKATTALQAIGTMTMKVAPEAGPAAPFLAIGGAIANLFGSIFGGHAAAVGREQAALCAAIPAANQFLQQIDQALASGQVTASQASSLLDQVVQQYESGVAPIIKMSNSSCNAACVYLRELQAIVAKRKAQYADAATAASASISPSGAATAPSSGSNLLPWAAAAGVLLLLLKGGF
jgi:hypothetical protein